MARFESRDLTVTKLATGTDTYDCQCTNVTEIESPACSRDVAHNADLAQIQAQLVEVVASR